MTGLPRCKSSISVCRLQFALVLPGDVPAEDDRQLVGWAQVAIGIEESFAQLVECGATAEDQVLAEFDLGKEQLMPATVLPPLLGTKERNQWIQPLVPTADQLLRR